MFGQPLEPLVPPDLARLAAAGETRRIARGGQPVSVSEVLQREVRAMDAADRAAERASGRYRLISPRMAKRTSLLARWFRKRTR